MVGQIIPAGQFNPAALSASGAYIAIQNPPGFITGVPTDVIGLVGTASWGPVNQPVHIGSGQDAVQAFGPVGAAALTDQYDLATDLQLAFMQAQSQASLEGWAVRVTDGTDTSASTVLAGVATGTAETATIGGTIAAGDTVSITFTSAGIVGSPVTVTYTCLTADTTATTAAGLAAAININQSIVAAQGYALAAGSVVSIYFPATTTVTYGEAVTPVSGGPTVTLATGSTTTNGATLRAQYTGSGGNLVSATIATGTATNTFTVTLVPPYGGVSEIYPNLPGTGFWQALSNAINNGVSAARPPSQICKISVINNAVGTPTTGTFTLANGTDGRTGVVAATLLGSDTAVPRTGLYALRAQNPGVGIVWIVGHVSNTLLASLLAFGQSEACSVLWAFPPSTSTSTATTDLITYGQSDPSLNILKDWIYFFDANNKQTRLVPPTAVFGGMWATYAPQNSPDNKQVYGVLGTERNPPNSIAAIPYTLSEIGQLQAAGISIITNPINAGAFFGTWGGRSTSSDPATQPSEYWRMTTYIARSLSNYAGKYVGQLQSQQPNDPLRRKIKTELNNYFNLLLSNGQIDAAQVLCEFTATGSAGNGYNNPASISQHYLYALAKVTYLASVWFFILTLQGGTTVEVQATNQLPTA